MQHTYEVQQSHMDNMIRQVALMAEMIKEVKENRAESEVNESMEMEEVVREAEEKKPANAEKESGSLPEEKETEEIEADEEKAYTEGKSMTSPPDNELSREILEEACDESRLNEEAIECEEEIDSTPFYLQSNKVHASEGKVKEFTTMVNGEESTPGEEPLPVIDESEGCSYGEEKTEWKEEITRRKAARAIYWVQLQPWPEPKRMGKPSHSGVLPKENKKILGTYRHHRKRRDAMLVIIPLENSVDGRKKSRVKISESLLFSERTTDTLN